MQDIPEPVLLQRLSEAGCPYEAQHFYLRLFQRYNGLVLTWKEYQTICSAIKHGVLKPLKQGRESSPTAAYKYVLNRKDGSQYRFYFIAYRDGRRLVSAYKPKWIQRTKQYSRKRERRNKV